ncbi:MAG: TIGR03985 family CRISPR-associated protein [Thermostichus sp. HHBFW_bins_43]
MDFQLSLTVETLQWLSGNRLDQRLHQAVRLYHVLCVLYGRTIPNIGPENQGLPDPFGYSHLRRLLFSPHHPAQDPFQRQNQPCQDPDCLCQRPLSTWLESIGEELQSLLRIPSQSWQKNLATCPFGYGDRTLTKMMDQLTDLGWLRKAKPTQLERTDRNKFSRVSSVDWPQPPRRISTNSEHWASLAEVLGDLSFMDPRLPEILESMGQPIHRRFFVHLDFVFPKDVEDEVEDIQLALQEVWQQEPILPVRFVYDTRDKGPQPLIVYPICLYYARRAKYLSAFGQTPDYRIGYHNFRLDRMHKLRKLTWNDTKLPSDLLNLYLEKKLPTPEEIEQAWEEAWGSDFYLPKAWLLIRFRQDFARRYVVQTERHPTFKLVAYSKISALVRQNVENIQQQDRILKIVKNRSPEDVYFQAWIRQGDTNITMRLRDWRPNGEVIAPIPVREQMKSEAAQELAFYNL